MGKVAVAEHLGSDTFLHITVEGIGQITARAGGGSRQSGDTVFVSPDTDRIHRFNEKGLAA